MKYLSFFKLRFAVGLQYRFSAIAGLATQFFWGAMMIFLYEALYKNGIDPPMKWTELVSYVWLGQAFFAIVFYRNLDSDIFDCIKNGQIAYELVRPLNLYWMWFTKICAQRLSACALRFLPVLVVSALLPSNYSLTGPDSFGAFILFIATLLLGFNISSALLMLIVLIIPGLREIFHIPVLPSGNILEILILVFSPILIVEIFKFFGKKNVK
jgi:ABC-2 type transport system permease protein